MGYSEFAATPQLAMQLTDENSGSLNDDVEAWVKAHLLPLVPSATKLVSIDGLDGVGKSTLAKAMADCSGATLIQLDTFLEQDQNRYLDALDLVAFKATVLKSPKAIAEGCLVQAVLAKGGLSSEFSIYVVRTTKMFGQPDAEWIDERDLLFGDMGAEERIAEEEALMRQWDEFFPDSGTSPTSYRVPGLRQELIRYHVEMCPHQRADLILKLVSMT